MKIILLLVIFLPMVIGILFPFLKEGKRRLRLTLLIGLLTFEFAGSILMACLPEQTLMLLRLSDKIRLSFTTDGLGCLFAVLASGLWLAVGIYSPKYMAHEGRENRFYGFYLIVIGAILGMDFADNLVCMYVLFELMTFSALPLVIHNQSKEAMAAGMKYLYYSIGGAFLGLLGIVCTAVYAPDLTFKLGGTMGTLAGHETFLQIILFVAVIGFGTKAGMYPMHGWLPSAHPVAPAPASAVLSAVIAKAGVLAIIRLLYYVVGVQLLAGSWVQFALLGLATLTVFMGSMMAYRENLLKKRLAYSTVSQISYVLIGVFLFTPEGLAGGLLHTVFHAVIKTGLFLFAGSVILHTGKTKVDELSGLGKSMPVTLWGFTFLSLALIGIPPCSGFVSKWALMSASLDSATGIFTWLAPVVLLVSALLTAGYLLPITVHGFFPGAKAEGTERIAADRPMTGAVLALSALSLLLGLFSEPLSRMVSAIVGIGG